MADCALQIVERLLKLDQLELEELLEFEPFVFQEFHLLLDLLVDEFGVGENVLGGIALKCNTHRAFRSSDLIL